MIFRMFSSIPKRRKLSVLVETRDTEKCNIEKKGKNIVEKMEGVKKQLVSFASHRKMRDANVYGSITLT